MNFRLFFFIKNPERGNWLIQDKKTFNKNGRLLVAHWDIYKWSPPGLDFTTPCCSEWGITVNYSKKKIYWRYKVNMKGKFFVFSKDSFFWHVSENMKFLKKYETKLKKACRFEISVNFLVIIYTPYIPVLILI